MERRSMKTWTLWHLLATLLSCWQRVNAGSKRHQPVQPLHPCHRQSQLNHQHIQNIRSHYQEIHHQEVRVTFFRNKYASQYEYYTNIILLIFNLLDDLVIILQQLSHRLSIIGRRHRASMSLNPYCRYSNTLQCIRLYY